jgi:hypothetical protein
VIEFFKYLFCDLLTYSPGPAFPFFLPGTVTLFDWALVFWSLKTWHSPEFTPGFPLIPVVNPGIKSTAKLKKFFDDPANNSSELKGNFE